MPAAAAAVRDRAIEVIHRRRPYLTMACLAVGLALAPAGLVAALTAAVCAAALGLPAGPRAALVAPLLVMAAFGVGLARLGAIDRPAHAAPPGTVLIARATLLERPRAGAFGSSAPMRIDSGSAAGLHVMARRRDARWPSSDPGTRFRIRGLVVPARAPATPSDSLFGVTISEANAGKPGTPGFGPLPALPTTADDFDYAAFLRSRGIGRELRLESATPVGRRRGVAGMVDGIRRRAETGLSSGLSSDDAALARGMVLGEDGDVSADTRDDFRRSGLAHLLAASGQNVALLCALVLPALMLAGVSHRVRVAVLMPLVWLYVALAGAGASVTRAGIMAAAALIALAASRRASALYALVLAAAITLGVNPRATGDPGWQLSFAAVLGMLTLGPLIRARLGPSSGSPIRRRRDRLRAGLAEAIAVTAAATMSTAPLLAHDFGAVSIAALPANLIAAPAVAPIMWLGMAAAAAQQLAAIGAPLSWLVAALQSVAAPVDSLALRWVAGVAGRFADPSWAQAQVHIGWPLVVASYVGIGITLLMVRRTRGRIAAGRARLVDGLFGPTADRFRALRPGTRRAVFVAIGVAALGGVARAVAPPPPPDSATVDFLDVGQGDSTLIRDATGAAVLFDGGIPEARVDRTLKHLGVSRLSIVVSTHQSRDHHGGLLQVVKRFPVGLFLDGRYGSRDPSFLALEREVDRRHIPRRDVLEGEHLRAGQIDIRVLWPPPRGNAPPPADPNTRAAVAIVRIGRFSLFLSADAEAPVLLPLRLPRVDAMKVPHHGSAEEGLPQVLARLRPKIAAIECGRGNPFAHPRPSTLRALRVVPLVYRTDRDGTTELTVADGRIAIRTHR